MAYNAIDDQLAVGAVISGVTNYNTTNKQSLLNPMVEVILRPTAVTTSLTLAVSVSLDGTNFMTIYTSAVMTGAFYRRVVFSVSNAVSDSDAVGASANIYKGPILEQNIRVTLTPVGNATVNLDVLFSDPAKG